MRPHSSGLSRAGRRGASLYCLSMPTHAPLSTLEIACLEETRQALGVSEIADEIRPITGGGIANRCRPGTWLNYAVGMALDQSDPPVRVPRAELEDLIEWYRSAGIEPRFEVSPFTHASFLKDCEELGLVLRSFQNVLFRQLTPNEVIETAQPAAEGIEIRQVDPANESQIRAYVQTALSGFFPEDAPPQEADFEQAARCVRNPRTVALTAWLDGKLVGAGGLEMHERIGTLFGLSVIPEARRKGVQQALIAARLRVLRDRGVFLATIGSRPGEGTERNVWRMGFQVAYTKVVLVKPEKGLVPTPG